MGEILRPGPAEGSIEALHSGAGGLSPGLQYVEGVEQAFIYVKLRFDARIAQIFHIAQRFTIERLPRAYEGI